MIITREQARRNQVHAVLWAFCLFGALLGLTFLLAQTSIVFAGLSFLAAVVIPIWLYRAYTRKYQRRLATQAKRFPEESHQFLMQRVAFYSRLSASERDRFQQELMIFLDEIPIRGIGCEVDHASRLLVGASAIIPVFGFPAWEYDMLDEVLLYPRAFDATFDEADGTDLMAQGMVGGRGIFNGVMVLSKPDLLHGYAIHGDRQNVGIHEFVHLIDKATGSIDGIPVTLPAECFRPWLELVHDEVVRGRAQESDIDGYAFTSEEEFFAVASEYFFEAPEKLEQKHPELFALMQRIFRQDVKKRFRGLGYRKFLRKRIRRNAPCPCGSGKKYKACCGRR